MSHNEIPTQLSRERKREIDTLLAQYVERVRPGISTMRLSQVKSLIANLDLKSVTPPAVSIGNPSPIGMLFQSELIDT